MARSSALGAALLALCIAVPTPALADVKAGVDAWSAGNYAAAVAEWRGPAASGDADAQFNMAQAYRLGRGVEANAKQAEVFYAKAAAQGHLKAADNLGLLMFQDGRRQEAMPYVQAAAGRGDPRAQYLLGIAHFNGDLVEKDWVRAYALLTLANSAGLPQAAPAIAQMDDFIPLAQREQAQIVAVDLKQKADAQRVSQLAAADLNGGAATSVAPPPAPVRSVAAAPVRQNPGGAAAIPRPIPTTSVAPSVAAAQAAVAEAQRVTGTESPAEAGAPYTRPTSAPPVRSAAASPVRTPAPAQARAPAPQPRPAPAPAATASSGPWKVQLGAFSVKSNAERLWSRLASRSELSGSSKLLVPSGRVTRLLAAGFASRGDAQSACTALKRGGQDCLVTR
ncbi:SPOR domain-containing protein [Qipengyuania sp. DSG2-2]|uniref:SPOR domain-containing protein n=1 Tax=Qipengyuania sp. DGS2-2 TaxID=3349631 RepID=UPI0036D400CE